MHENNRLTAVVSVIRDDGQVLFTKLADESWSFGTDENEAARWYGRVERWLEKMPTPDFDPEVFVRREFDPYEIERIVDAMHRPERLYLTETVFDAA